MEAMRDASLLSLGNGSCKVEAQLIKPTQAANYPLNCTSYSSFLLNLWFSTSMYCTHFGWNYHGSILNNYIISNALVYNKATIMLNENMRWTCNVQLSSQKLKISTWSEYQFNVYSKFGTILQYASEEGVNFQNAINIISCLL